MTSSESYYDAAAQEEDFQDSVIIRPISLKPTVVPSILGRGNPDNTILAAYDKIKLTEYIESPEQGRVIQLISLEQKSHLTIINPEGIELLERFSGTDIAFVMVTGQKTSGKSFFIDKILNLSNVQGNNFSMTQSKPSINVWSTPFVKQELRFFVAEISGCAPGSKQFDRLLPYITILSSVIINLEDFKQKFTPRSYERLDQKLNNFLDQFSSQKLTESENRLEVLNSIFPKIIYKVAREAKQNHYFVSRSQLRAQQFYLPNAKNPEYRGIDEDLRIHSFLNKKCVNEQYIQKVSDLFSKIFVQVQEKKHRQLVFNGGIILKYLSQLSLLFHKGRKIDIGQVYYDIVKDLYISAYNYCVICYHEALEKALQDERPRALEELIEIFQTTSNQILQKYNEFSLQKSIHKEYQQKLEKHIESKQRLIIQINRKKTEIELRKIYDESINLNDIQKVWGQMNQVNKAYPNYNHGRDQIMGRKLSEIIKKLSSGNNVDYILKKNIDKLAQQIQAKNEELASIREYNKKIKSESDEKKKIGEKQKAELIYQNTEKDKRIQELKQEIKSYQKNEFSGDPVKQKANENALKEKFDKNEKVLEQLRIEQSKPIETKIQIRDLQKRIQQIKNKYLSQELTFKEIQGNIKGNQNAQVQQTQLKLKKESSNTGQKKQEQNKQGSQGIVNSKKIKKEGK